MAHVMNVGPLDDPYIGALEWGGWVWTNNDTFRAPVSLGYFLENDTSDWSGIEATAIANALQSWANVANITFHTTDSAASADLIEHSVPPDFFPDSSTLGEHGTPEDAAQSSNQFDGDILLGGNTYAHGYFDFDGYGWDYGNSEGGLNIGGYGYWTAVHELGHGLGLAHPHDDGGGSGIFPGAEEYQTGSNGLNQGVWTVMSYIATQDESSANSNQDGDDKWYDGSGNSVANYGYYAGPMAFDIAAIQDLYGANTNFHNNSDMYYLPETNGLGTYFTCLWDTGGNDSIAYNGPWNATISLVAATLDNSVTGGGVISSANGIHGGYTIANGVVIENAYGGSGSDTLVGNSVGNILSGGAGADDMTGGGGNDTYYVENAGDVIHENGGGTDQVYCYLQSYTLGSNLENLNFLGNPSQSYYGYGNSLSNLIQTYHGDDVLDGRGGADTMQGYNGNDTYYVDNTGDVVLESLNQGTSDWVYTTLTSYTLGANVENVNYFGTSTVGFTGNGNELDNTILGWNGDDYLDGKGGADVMRGYDGNDNFYVDNTGDVVQEFNGLAGGNDWVRSYLTSYTLGDSVENLDYVGTSTLAFTGIGNAANNTIQGWGGNDVLDGRGGADLMRGYAGNDWFYVDNAGDVVDDIVGAGTLDRVFASTSWTLSAGAEIENLSTTSNSGTAAINLTGNELANLIYGNAGDNILDGKAGADRMIGLGGNDWYRVDNAGDVVTDGVGQGTADRVFASTSWTLTAGSEIENLSTNTNDGTASINLTGNELANTIYGNAGNNVLDGKAGADRMIGLGGNDWYHVDNIGDVVTDGVGQGTADRVFASTSWTLTTSAEIEILSTSSNAGTAAINLTGNERGNMIYGNAGVNFLDGRAGADTLIGLGGNDTFVFHRGEANGDIVNDFAGNGASAGDGLRFIGYGAGATFTDIDATHWEVNYNGGASHDIITFSNAATIHQSDWIFA